MALLTNMPAELFRSILQFENFHLDAVQNQLEGEDTPVGLMETT